ncbi:mechanosensitive ion channel family protein [Gulbenkiania mobilis]|uniref:Mechanosensitive ion channel-like protein n=1 Tax=Gulbenkiania mobilis TaxID=397457 RepID=A0ABY2D1N7_GULMO|nr:mechanosensitive ion channel-like protein [Gulbenkiania mobilis]
MFYEHGFTVEMLWEALQTVDGLIELVLGLVCGLAGWWTARLVYKRWFFGHPERYDRFLPYIGFRIVFPGVGFLLSFAVLVVWALPLGRAALVLPAITAMLFWLAAIRLVTAVIRQAFPHHRYERSTEHFLASLLWVAFISWAIGFDDVVLDWLDAIALPVGKTRLSLLTILNGLVWVSIIMVVALWVSRLFESRLMRLKHLDLNLRIVFSKLARTLFIIVAVLVALPIVGIDLTVLSVFGGALGVGLGFGLQKIASNYVSGFIILLDRSIRIGDRLMIDTRVGYVEKITARHTVLKLLDGSEALVPNEVLIGNTVINQSYTDKRISTSLALQVAYGTDLDLALRILVETADSPRIQQDPPPTAFVTAFADSGINLELYMWVLDPENGFLGLKSEIYRRVWKAFEAQGIEVPYPRRDIHLFQEGPARPAIPDREA